MPQEEMLKVGSGVHDMEMCENPKQKCPCVNAYWWLVMYSQVLFTLFSTSGCELLIAHNKKNTKSKHSITFKVKSILVKQANKSQNK